MLIYILPLSALLIFLITNYVFVLIQHKKSKRQFLLFKEQPIFKEATLLPKIKMKYRVIRGAKEYISIINGCDLYLGKDYFLVIPFQTFPFKAYNKLIFLTNNKDNLRSYFYYADRYNIGKIILKEKIKLEIEIRFQERYNKYYLKLQPTESDKFIILESLKKFSEISSY